MFNKRSIALTALCVVLSAGVALADKDDHDHGDEHAHEHEHEHKHEAAHDHDHDEHEHRQLDAHEHGVSVLTAAFEGEELEMELESPGADIVGFEHEPESAEDQAAITAALASLGAPTSLIALPAAAECETEETETDLHMEGEHSEFHARYRFHCHAPAKLTAIEFPFFTRFPDAGEIELKLVTSKGQFAYEIERDEPRVDISGAL